MQIAERLLRQLVNKEPLRLTESFLYAGPIIRINPDELHCADPYFLDEIYPASSVRVRDKWHHLTKAVGPVTLSGFSTVLHEEHRYKRAPVQNFFSRQQILKLEGEVVELAHLVVTKLLSGANGSPVNMKEVFNCFAADIISQFSFGEPMGFVAQPESWTPNFATWTEPAINISLLVRHSAILRGLMKALPFLANYLGEDFKAYTKQVTVTIPGYIRAAYQKPASGRVFAELVQPFNTPAELETSIDQLSGEGVAILAAGTETTAVSQPRVALSPGLLFLTDQNDRPL